MTFYAVRKGLNPGIYYTWEDCQSQINGFSGAEFKKFKTEQEALDFIQNTNDVNYYKKKEKKENSITKRNEKQDINLPDVYAFVDGSFNPSTGIYGYGGFVVVNGVKNIIQGSGNNSDMSNMNNVAGEILGSKAAIEFALENNLSEITILYDYKGIECWTKQPGEKDFWKANLSETIAYRDFVAQARQKMKINFLKVAAHTGIDGNEEADKLAKKSVGII